MKQNMPSHPLVLLAGKAIKSYLAKEPLPGPDDAPGFEKPAGAFVSIKKKGQLRGCIGTIQPVRPTLAEEVVDNAVSAAVRDPRFPPLTLDELDEISISVDVLTRPEPVSTLEELDPARYGVIVQSGSRKGLLLPDLPDVDTVEQQVGIAMRKAGIGPSESIQLYRFEVRRYF
jgi:AmmeMemoRadiSam system protein A